MRKFAVFSGFLGAGKTSAMMALTGLVSSKYGKAAMITNDLGGKGLADHRLAQLRGCNASELTEECICYQTENLVNRLNQLFDGDGCQLVISDIPGFGVGALEHVYHRLHEQYPSEFDLAPFTVLVEPETVTLLKQGGADLEYILDTQLMEADLIVLNKCDLLGQADKNSALEYLRSRYPQAQVLGVSVRTGDGLETLAQSLLGGKASLRSPDIGYGGEAFSSAMGQISEYNIQYHARVCCNDFNGNAYLISLAETVRSGIRAGDWQIPHMKLLAWEPEGEYGRVDLLGTERPVEVNQSFCRPCTELAVVINTSAACPADKLDEIITGAVASVSQAYQLEWIQYKKECFGMG